MRCIQRSIPADWTGEGKLTDRLGLATDHSDDLIGLGKDRRGDFARTL